MKLRLEERSYGYNNEATVRRMKLRLEEWRYGWNNEATDNSMKLLEMEGDGIWMCENN